MKIALILNLKLISYKSIGIKVSFVCAADNYFAMCRLTTTIIMITELRLNSGCLYGK